LRFTNFNTYIDKMKQKLLIAFISLIPFTKNSFSQNDTLRVIAYNVLHYGDGCQGSNGYLHSKLKTIVQYANPDVIGLVKMQVIKLSATDGNGISPVGFADSVVNYALDAAYPGRYAYCTLTDYANGNDNDMDVLFYNQNKLGFVSVKNLCDIEEDFDLYKLYYKDPNLSSTHDTTFLYFVLNHTVSGSTTNNIDSRNQQDTLVIHNLKNIFYHLPNLISMGDFNTHISTEAGYEMYTTTTDTSFLFYDPPFGIDHVFNYPLAWNGCSSCQAYLNTTTRASATVPNSCGTSGGLGDWFIHILLSGWLTNNFDYIKYIPHSYTTIGNNGNRLNISVNDSTTHGLNTSAPQNVLDAIFNLSDKYPVMVKLGVTYNTTGTGPANPVSSINKITNSQALIKTNNPVQNTITIQFPSDMAGQKATITWYDVTGKLLSTEEYIISDQINRAVDLEQGTYILHIQTNQESFTARILKL